MKKLAVPGQTAVNEFERSLRRSLGSCVSILDFELLKKLKNAIAGKSAKIGQSPSNTPALTVLRTSGNDLLPYFSVELRSFRILEFEKTMRWSGTNDKCQLIFQLVY